MKIPLLEIKNLQVTFNTDYGKVVAVENLNFVLEPGQTLGVVGESGSGKSVTSLAIMQLLPKHITEVGHQSEIKYLGDDLLKLNEQRMQAIRGSEISMIFQEPTKCLNPVFRVGYQVMEAILTHQEMSKTEAQNRTIELFQEVGIPDPEQRIQMYPHEMSGGQQQRVMIAMALSCNPNLLIADEPTTALDVTIQAQILKVLRRIIDERNMGLIFISHDLGVISEIADTVAIMQNGQLVESGNRNDIFHSPKMGYTKGLLACRPTLESSEQRLQTISDFLYSKKEGMVSTNNQQENNRELDINNPVNRSMYLHPLTKLIDIGFPENPKDYPTGCEFVPENEKPLLKIEDLRVHFQMRGSFFQKSKNTIKANDDISLEVYKGQTLGLVGESGCGKTTLGRAILRLINTTQGQITYDGYNLTKLSAKAMRPFRKRIQIIFQDPYGSLNPRMTTEDTLTEPMLIHNIGDSHEERRQIMLDLLEKVDMNNESYLTRYPHEFSGGQRQRICIARSLSVQPELIVCDESVSALDVSVQAQVLNLLKDLQDELGLSYVFISHDLSVVKFMSDMMAVMNEGKIVEFGPADSIYSNPKENYTRRLIESIPNDTEHFTKS
jgi:peptide/nickel transport system ATP-binding protein